ncbi:MAG: polyamine aminopropyltransferase [Burkholderiales bacterium]
MTHDRLLILSVFVVASCGLAYELVAGALASYLLGDSVLQFSTVIGAYLFAMGIGAHLSKYVPDRDVLARFVEIELLVALVGGVSAALLFVVFAWAGTPFRVVLYAMVLIIGTLVGMEIPLVMRVLDARRAAFADIVSRVLTFDYLGALAVSVLFPLVLAPQLGLARTALLFGLLNAAVALWVARRFRAELPQWRTLVLKGCGVAAVLALGMAGSDRLIGWAERGLFGDEIVHARTSIYQRMVVTRWKDDTRLYLNGNLQFSSRDEHRYHEALVLPAMENHPAPRRVLILGGGDGLAAREVLRYPTVERITLVDLDAAMTDLFSTASDLVELNRGSLRDPRVTVVNRDAFLWLEATDDAPYDVAIVDLPDPTNHSLGKLYSVPFYARLRQVLTPRAQVAVQAASPWFAPHAFWSVVATLKEAGYATVPYHAHVPSFGEWGFVAASPQGGFVPPSTYRVTTRFLDATSTAQMFSFPPDMGPREVEPNWLNTQRLVQYFHEDWSRVAR